MKDKTFTQEEIMLLSSKKGLKQLLSGDEVKTSRAIKEVEYEADLKELQVELIKMQNWVVEKEKRVVIIFEGRDAAGKGGAIRRFTEHLNPRALRVVALPVPTEEEKGQWYFQRYIQQLPNRGEMVFFDRSWYNRAIVEPVNDFCTPKQYKRFMREVNSFEQMLMEDGIMLVKFYMSISKAEQKRRFAAIKENPLKRWKMSPVDEKAQELWDKYTHYKKEMFRRTNTSDNPWVIVKANNKNKARLQSIRYVLSQIPYDKNQNPNPNGSEKKK